MHDPYCVDALQQNVKDGKVWHVVDFQRMMMQQQQQQQQLKHMMDDGLPQMWRKKKSNSKILFPNKISFQDGGAMDHIRIWSSLLMLYYFCETCGSKKRIGSLGQGGTKKLHGDHEEAKRGTMGFKCLISHYNQQRHRMLHVQGESRVE